MTIHRTLFKEENISSLCACLWRETELQGGRHSL